MSTKVDLIYYQKGEKLEEVKDYTYLHELKK